MRESKIYRRVIPLAGAVCALGLSSMSRGAVFVGNGAGGFGGAIGSGNLSVTEDGSGNVTFTLNNNSSLGTNDFVLYLDTVAGGYTDTSTFSDNNDGGRESISAENTGNPSRDLITFSPGFTADYALEFENDTYDGLFQLESGGNNSLNYVAGNGPSTAGGPYVVTFPLADLGISTGTPFSLEGDLISTSAYGSNETIGASTTDAGANDNPGFNGTLNFTSADSVPEPTSMFAIAAGGLMLLRRRKV